VLKQSCGVFQRAIVVLLVTALLGLVPAACADPPDPTWPGGYWNDDDFDSVFFAIVSMCAVEAASLTVPGPLWTLPIDVQALQPSFVRVSSHAAASPRWPPI
jgi:hypothetical protein